MRTCLERLVTDGSLEQLGLLIERLFPTLGSDEQQSQLRRRIAGADPSEAYKKAFEGWRYAVTDMACWTFEATLATRLTVGLGVANPGENGIALQRTYGMPLIPGSTIKGALRACALEMCGVKDNVEPRWKREEAPPEAQPALQVFGATDAMAAVTCFDAWWVPEGKPFCVETWTPHHQGYMTKGQGLPLESEEPTPLGLFAVPKGAKFWFAFLVPNPQAEWIAALVPVVKLALERGLSAKHSQGYGRFVVPNLAPEERRQVVRPQIVQEVVLRDGPQDLPGIFHRQDRKCWIEFPGGETRHVIDPRNVDDGSPVRVQVTVTNGRIQAQIQGRNVRPRSD